MFHRLRAPRRRAAGSAEAQAGTPSAIGMTMWMPSARTRATA